MFAVVESAQALLDKMRRLNSKKWQFTDFALEDVLFALKTIEKLESGQDSEVDDSKQLKCVSGIMIALEGVLTASVADESEWSTSWTKLIRHVLKNKSIPETVQQAGIDVPKEFKYMLTAKVGGVCSSPIKTEVDDARTARPTKSSVAQEGLDDGPASGRLGLN